MISESQKRSARKWDRENMRSVSCRLRKEDAELFKTYCEANGTNPAAVLKTFIHERLNEFTAQDEADKEAE